MKDNSCHAPRVPFQYLYGFLLRRTWLHLGRDCPEFYGSVTARREDLAALGLKGDTRYRPDVTRVLTLQFSVACVPQKESPITCAGSNERIVGTQSHRRDGCAGACEFANLLTVGEMGESYRLIRARGDQLIPIC